MSNFNIAKKRAEHNSVYNLKDRTFKTRLEKDYNSELIQKIEDETTNFKAIIQHSRLGDKVDYKKISLPFSTEITTGDIIFWEREKTNWLIYLRRSTEKNYFLGEMLEANYLIKWKDGNGKSLEQLASFKRNNGSELEVANLYLHHLEGDAQLLMPKNSNSLKLKLYDKFIVERSIWSVTGYDDTSYDNIIMFFLEETEKNKDLDTEDLPNGKIKEAVEIKTNFDKIGKAQLNSYNKLEISTFVNNKPIKDNYIVNTTDCFYNDSSILFDAVGVAFIQIKSEATDKTLELLIEVEDIEIEEIYYEIDGLSIVKTGLPYTYSFVKNTNGSKAVIDNAIWRLSSKKAGVIKNLADGSIEITFGKTTGNVVLYCNVENEEYQKEIQIKSLLL